MTCRDKGRRLSNKNQVIKYHLKSSKKEESSTVIISIQELLVVDLSSLSNFCLLRLSYSLSYKRHFYIFFYFSVNQPGNICPVTYLYGYMLSLNLTTLSYFLCLTWFNNYS